MSGATVTATARSPARTSLVGVSVDDASLLAQVRLERGLQLRDLHLQLVLSLPPLPLPLQVKGTAFTVAWVTGLLFYNPMGHCDII